MTIVHRWTIVHIFEIPGKSLRTTAVKNYVAFLRKRSDKLQSFFSGGDLEYLCKGEIKDYYLSLNNKGFMFGKIKPGATYKGDIAFDIPITLSGLKTNSGKSKENASKQYAATVKFLFTINKKVETFSFPVQVSWDSLDTIPYPIFKYLK